MPLHKIVKLEVEIEIPDSQANNNVYNYLTAGPYVDIINVRTISVTDKKIEPKIDEKQRAMNEYKRIIQSAIDQSEFKQLKMRGHKRWREGQIEIGLPSKWGSQLYAVLSLNCEKTVLSHSFWQRTTTVEGVKAHQDVVKFELERPTVISELSAYLNKIVAEFKDSASGKEVKW